MQPGTPHPPGAPKCNGAHHTWQNPVRFLSTNSIRTFDPVPSPTTPGGTADWGRPARSRQCWRAGLPGGSRAAPIAECCMTSSYSSAVTPSASVSSSLRTQACPCRAAARNIGPPGAAGRGMPRRGGERSLTVLDELAATERGPGLRHHRLGDQHVVLIECWHRQLLEVQHPQHRPSTMIGSDSSDPGSTSGSRPDSRDRSVRHASDRPCPDPL